MRKSLTVLIAAAPLTVALSAAAMPAHAAPPPLVTVTPATGPVVPGEYIVTLRPGASAAATGIAAQTVYRHALNGFAAKLTGAQLAALQRNPDIARIEHNQYVHANSVQSPTPSWGLDRIDQRFLPLNNQYVYFATGLGVSAYVIDTGIDPTHPDFGGRAAVAYDATGGNGIDCNGHGTHVAGTVGSASYGVAKRVALRGVKVLGCTGSGTISDVIEGVDWVTANGRRPAVANMSLGGSKTLSLDNAVNRLAASGVFVSVAGGSSASDACNFSPSGASGAFAVAASDIADRAASFNNRGPCIKLYAPGVQITSTWLAGGTRILSGASMAAPHVAGVAAMYKQTFGDQASTTVAAWLIQVATVGVLTGVPVGTPNRLLYTNRI